LVIDRNDDTDNKLVAKLSSTLQLGTDTASHVRRVLVLLDCNGLLVHLYRSELEKRCPDKRPRKGIKPDFFVPFDNEFWLRPYVREFVAHLLNDPRCQVRLAHAQSYMA
jgi:hypothetical protein